ncbi:hypothetical protein CUMW_278980 [Citrus unshiu]|uniref:Uncharacterized protein n=1 Tax=Citrus unshiu TaxID=55188 RepID=A0A2H5N6T3_CITUN|nr:hypothetical protein CUMW_278970 [Citrus unshiu]GAY35944.1 hypothetical protein CUMW_278970 [Citrus unshiu]GAY35946.1 hypothetical protein CUMW_278970 [Citrus unshiu]GAY35948.1 hypothetical protein CUMW_278970 [Citrus unshiu]GAY35950.1 hypothetical protein CUMW_278980 [Citrus unshiu]
MDVSHFGYYSTNPSVKSSSSSSLALSVNGLRRPAPSVQHEGNGLCVNGIHGMNSLSSAKLILSSQPGA